MKRTLFSYTWIVTLVIVANAWLYHALSTWELSFAPRPTTTIWYDMLTWLAVIPQLPSLVVSKIVADSLSLTIFGWVATTSLVSILIYCSLFYFWSRTRKMVFR